MRARSWIARCACMIRNTRTICARIGTRRFPTPRSMSSLPRSVSRAFRSVSRMTVSVAGEITDALLVKRVFRRIRHGHRILPNSLLSKRNLPKNLRGLGRQNLAWQNARLYALSSLKAASRISCSRLPIKKIIKKNSRSKPQNRPFSPKRAQSRNETPKRKRPACYPCGPPESAYFFLISSTKPLTIKATMMMTMIAAITQIASAGKKLKSMGSSLLKRT